MSVSADFGVCSLRVHIDSIGDYTRISFAFLCSRRNPTMVSTVLHMQDLRRKGALPDAALRQWGTMAVIRPNFSCESTLLITCANTFNLLIYAFNHMLTRLLHTGRVVARALARSCSPPTSLPKWTIDIRTIFFCQYVENYECNELAGI